MGRRTVGGALGLLSRGATRRRDVSASAPCADAAERFPPLHSQANFQQHRIALSSIRNYRDEVVVRVAARCLRFLLCQYRPSTRVIQALGHYQRWRGFQFRRRFVHEGPIDRVGLVLPDFIAMRYQPFIRAIGVAVFESRISPSPLEVQTASTRPNLSPPSAITARLGFARPTLDGKIQKDALSLRQISFGVLQFGFGGL